MPASARYFKFRSPGVALVRAAFFLSCALPASAEAQFERTLPAEPPIDRGFEKRSGIPLPKLARKDLNFETTQFPARTLTLNGVNISGLRSQEFENVEVRIDANGNVELRAPHYEVRQDASYHPLFPGELPRLPKERTRPMDLPEGRYSKRPVLDAPPVSAAPSERDVPPLASPPGARSAAAGNEGDLPPGIPGGALAKRETDPMSGLGARSKETDAAAPVPAAGNK